MSRLLNGIDTIRLCYGCAERHSPSLQICPRCVTGAVNAGCNRCGLIFLIAFCVLLVLALLGCHPKAACSVWGFLYKRWVNTQGGVILCLGSERKKKRIWEQWCSATEVVLRSISARRQNPAQQKTQEDEADMCKTFFFLITRTGMVAGQGHVALICQQRASPELQHSPPCASPMTSLSVRRCHQGRALKQRRMQMMAWA